MQWTRGTPDHHQRTCFKIYLSESTVTIHQGVVTIEINRDRWTHQIIKTIWWRSNECDQTTLLFTRATWTHPDPHSVIGLSRLNRVVSIKRYLISTLDRDATGDPTITPLFSYILNCSSNGNVPLDFQVKSNSLNTTIQASIDLFLFLMHFCVRGAFEIENWSRDQGEITSWTPSSSSKIRNE